MLESIVSLRQKPIKRIFPVVISSPIESLLLILQKMSRYLIRLLVLRYFLLGLHRTVHHVALVTWVRQFGCLSRISQERRRLIGKHGFVECERRVLGRFATHESSGLHLFVQSLFNQHVFGDFRVASLLFVF